MNALIANPREAFPVASEQGRVPYSSAPPSGPDSRPWVLRFAEVPDASQAIAVPPTVYDNELQLSVGLYGGPLPYMQTHSPTVPDGSTTNPPPLDEGTKD
jgi:putative ATP-grasp target RiPP